MISLEIPNFAMFSWVRMHLCIILWTYVVLTYAKLINVTVDDQNGDPATSSHIQYSSLTDWAFNPNCTDCRAMFDLNQAYNGTWHNASYDAGLATQHPENATFDFTGSAIYVFGILSHSIAFPASGAELFFFIDGEQAGSFTHSPDSQQPDYTYNFPLYANESLQYAKHTFVLQNGQNGGPISLVLLDYLVYTMDDGTGTSTTSGSTSSSSGSPLPTLNGPISGTVAPQSANPKSDHTLVIALATALPISALLIFIVLLMLYRRRHRRQQQTVRDDSIMPFPPIRNKEPQMRLKHDDRLAVASSSRVGAFMEDGRTRMGSVHGVSTEDIREVDDFDYSETMPPPYASEAGDTL